jgi:hypothetical protein
MKKIGLTILPALLVGGALALSSVQANAVTIDASQSISVNYDFSGVSGPYNWFAYEVMGPNYVPGSSLDPYVAQFQINFYDSGNNLAGSSTNGQVGLGGGYDVAYLANNDSSTDPVGHAVLSSLGGSVFDVTSVLIGISNDANFVFTNLQDVTSSITTVSATPLPPTWTMMVIGLAGFGFAYRRKSKQALMAA